MKFYCTQIFNIVVLILMVPSIQFEWQGTGNMNETVMNKVNQLITKTPIGSTSSASNIDFIAKDISTTLNSLWDPAWNVVIVKQSFDCDTVLYGYAYNDHWMWINGMTVIGTTVKKLAFVIWKDYNCYGWAQFNTISSQSTFNSTQVGSIVSAQNFGTASLSTDIWGWAFNFVKRVQTNLPSGDFTAIVSQDRAATFYGYICLVNKNVRKYNHATTTPVPYLSYLIFQTRT